MAETMVAWAQALGRNRDIVREVETKVRRARRRRLVVYSGAVACLLLAGLGFYAGRNVPGLGGLWTTSTAIVSLPERQTLPDGSLVELKDGARVTPAFTAGGDDARRVILASGEAHFSVRKDAARDFIVEAGGVQIRAVGTAFSVAFDQSQVAVLVTEGRVAVASAEDAKTRRHEDAEQSDSRVSASFSVPPLAPLYVDAGKRMVVDVAAPTAQAPAPVAMERSEMAGYLSWRAPRIRFSNTPLSEAVAVFNRHSSVRLVLDPALDELRIGGVIRADNTDSFLLLLKTEFGIEPEPAAEGSLHLCRR